MNKNTGLIIGHISAAVTIFIWGTTFVSTKVLLNSFSPSEILFIRFVIGFAALALFCPRRLKTGSFKHELLFAAAGLCGVTLYYMLENAALLYTSASNTGVIISAAPLFTAIISRFTGKRDHLDPSFFIGLAAALAGIFIISFDGAASVQINPVGDLLALAAAAVWAVYSILSGKISSLGYPVILTTRRTFFYGVLFMIPILIFSGTGSGYEQFADPKNLLNLLYLGLGASALCFVTWNTAVTRLGAVKTSAYIYAVPLITVAASTLTLGERFTFPLAAGTVLTLAGLINSELSRGPKRR